jgi:N-acetyl-anhydromuramyl-L-alanine amidase AmpD
MNVVDLHLQFSETDNSNKPEQIIIHHSAGNMTVEQIHQLHKSNGWAGIGYHYVIDKDGIIYRGRQDYQVGAHCISHNQNSLGICFIGNFNNEEPSYAQYFSGQALIKFLCNLYDIRKYLIYPHKFYYPTDCPGANFDIKKIIDSDVNTIEIQKEGAELNWLRNTILRNGSMGVEVGMLQLILNHYGANLKVDNDFGGLTEYAVKDFQQKRNIGVDGIVGSESWSELLK